jgi:hypothetical protein
MPLHEIVPPIVRLQKLPEVKRKIDDQDQRQDDADFSLIVIAGGVRVNVAPISLHTPTDAKQDEEPNQADFQPQHVHSPR